MKPNRIAAIAFVAAVFATVPAFAQNASLTDAQKAFNTIKNMPGTWTGKASNGQEVNVDFKLTSAGSAVMSEISGKENMISMFAMDGPERLLLTHYCAAGNAPRMQAAVSPDGKTITFTYVDATNLATPHAGHMQQMILTVLDNNHHTETWIFADHGKEMREVFDLHRKV